MIIPCTNLKRLINENKREKFKVSTPLDFRLKASYKLKGINILLSWLLALLATSESLVNKSWVPILSMKASYKLITERYQHSFIKVVDTPSNKEKLGIKSHICKYCP